MGGEREETRERAAVEKLVSAPRIRDQLSARDTVSSGGAKAMDATASKDEQAGAATTARFLSTDDRQCMKPEFLRRTIVAQMNFRFGIERVRVAQLLQKEEDVGWAVSLLLDIAGMWLGATVAMQLKKLRFRSDALSALGQQADLASKFESWGPAAQVALSKTTYKQVDMLLKPVLDRGKHAAKARYKPIQNRERSAAKNESLSFLDMLSGAVDQAFQGFYETASSQASDAELLALFAGFDASLHQVHHYESAVRDKLGRFRRSGVPSIGRRESTDKILPGVDYLEKTFYGDTRVVLVSFMSGVPPRLAFQQQQRHDAEMDRPGNPFARAPSFGSAGPLNYDAEITRFVPAEFSDVAVARHEATWGAPISVIQVDDRKLPGKLPGHRIQDADAK